MLILTLKLLFAHLLGDFVFQPNHWVQNKRKEKIRSTFLYVHMFVHTAALFLVLGFSEMYYIAIWLIIFSHFAIDTLKLYLFRKKNQQVLFFADQLMHLLVILGISYLYAPIQINWDLYLSPELFALGCAILLLTSFSSIVMKVLISKWKPKEEKTLKNAGRYIGMLERLFIFGFIVIDFWEGIGFLLAAKSVFRFGDLTNAKDRNLTEYILIGTLLSFGLAILVAQSYLLVLELI